MLLWSSCSRRYKIQASIYHKLGRQIIGCNSHFHCMLKWKVHVSALKSQVLLRKCSSSPFQTKGDLAKNLVWKRSLIFSSTTIGSKTQPYPPARTLTYPPVFGFFSPVPWLMAGSSHSHWCNKINVSFSRLLKFFLLQSIIMSLKPSLILSSP